jgi:hypothetical protein
MILSHYGGFIVPPSFLCIHDLYDLYTSNLKEKGMFVIENINRGITHDQLTYFPNVQMMGAKKKNSIIEKCVEYQEYFILFQD